MSDFAAVTATFIKQHAEKSLLGHVQYLRELLDKRIVSTLVWMDTRDMTVDGLTKGVDSRDALHEIMTGLMITRHDKTVWNPKLGPKGSGTQEAETNASKSPKHVRFNPV